jgi:hypothetical protein
LRWRCCFRADESAKGGHALLIVGWPDAAWHLELVGDPGDATPAAPTEEDLLILYLVGEDLAGRLVNAGSTRVAARNPYWDRWGVTIADPDGYRLVLSSLSWPQQKPSPTASAAIEVCRQPACARGVGGGRARFYSPPDTPRDRLLVPARGAAACRPDRRPWSTPPAAARIADTLTQDSVIQHGQRRCADLADRHAAAVQLRLVFRTPLKGRFG